MAIGWNEPLCRLKRQKLGLVIQPTCEKCGSVIREGWRCAEEVPDVVTAPVGAVPILENRPTASREAKIEAAVRGVFEKRFAGQSLPYERTRELVWLERELVDEIVYTLKGA